MVLRLGYKKHPCVVSEGKIQTADGQIFDVNFASLREVSLRKAALQIAVNGFIILIVGASTFSRLSEITFKPVTKGAADLLIIAVMLVIIYVFVYVLSFQITEITKFRRKWIANNLAIYIERDDPPEVEAVIDSLISESKNKGVKSDEKGKTTAA